MSGNARFDHVVDTNKQLIPNGFIYLRAEPRTCHNRLNVRRFLSLQGALT